MDFLSNFIKRPMSLVLSDSVNVLTTNGSNQQDEEISQMKPNEIEATEAEEQQQQQHSPINTKAGAVGDVDAANKSNLALSAANARPRLTMPNFAEAVIEQLATNSAAGTANCELNSMNNDSERPTEHVGGNSTTESKRVSNRFIDLTRYDEADIPELPNNMSTEMGEDPLKLTFDDDNAADFNRDNLTADFTHLQLPNNDIDTALSSDNEIYAECLSYRDCELNFDFPTEISDTEHYRSALNSSENKTNEASGSLNTTMENRGDGESGNDARTSAASQSASNVTISQNNEFEPMDVDMNSTLEMSDNSNNSTMPIDYIFGTQKASEKEPTPEKLSQPAGGHSNASNDKIIEESGKSVQRIEQKRECGSENADDNIKPTDGGSLANSASETFQNDAEKTLNSAEKVGNVYDANSKELDLHVPPAEGTDLTSQKLSVTEKETKLRLAVESVLASNIGSPKQSPEISSNFPVKAINEKSKFPTSPDGLSEKPTKFLEPSEYTEQSNVQAERSPEPVSIQITCPSPQKEKTPVVRYAEQQLSDISSISPAITIDSVSTTTSPGANSTITISDQISPVSNHNTTYEGNSDLSPKSESPHTPAEFTVQASTDHRRTFNADPLSSQKQHKPENNRRTFTFLPEHENGDHTENASNKSSENRRTFNVSPCPSEHSTDQQQLNISYEPMEVDESFSQLPNSSEISPQQSSQPYQTSMAMKDIKSLSSSPTNPMSMLINRPTICSTATAAAAKILSQSPPLPALKNSTFVDDSSKMPPPPAAISPRPTKKRNPLTLNNVDANLNEGLSAKEQTKTNSKDEKDIFVEKFASTSSSSEEVFVSSSSMNPFGSSAGASQFSAMEQFKFGLNDADFLSSNNFILQPSDFDFLLTKGSNNEPVDRSSLLLRFDPLLGVPVPVNPTPEQQQALQKILQKADTAAGGGTRSVAPTITEEDPTQNQSENDCAKQQQQHQEQNVLSKKHANMSVDVIKDINIDNDCTKSYEHTNSQSDEKQANFKMDELEKKIKNEVLKTEDIEKKLKEGEQREEVLIKRITEKDKTISKMNGVIEAYEKAIAELIAEKEQITHNFDKQLTELRADRDSNYHHLTSLETTFSDLHVKYEKSKEMTLQLKSNEETLLSKIQQTMENLRMQEQRYDKMKNHAMMQLEIANKKLESMEKTHAVETTKLKAQLKKEEISRASISEQLQQRLRENEQLVKICDELISGQGS